MLSDVETWGRSRQRDWSAVDRAPATLEGAPVFEIRDTTVCGALGEAGGGYGGLGMTGP